MTTELIKKRSEISIETVESIPELKIIRTKVFPDTRGYFSESYNETEWSQKLNFNEKFKQIALFSTYNPNCPFIKALKDNHSYSIKGVLRGLHVQPGMGKLVSVVSGRIFDVAVDIRPNSSTFGKWFGLILDGGSGEKFWIPDGFLHGFYTLSDSGAHVVYKCTAVYNGQTEFGVNPFDDGIGIEWPIPSDMKPIVSDRDRAHKSLVDIDVEKIFHYLKSDA